MSTIKVSNNIYIYKDGGECVTRGYGHCKTSSMLIDYRWKRVEPLSGHDFFFNLET